MQKQTNKSEDSNFNGTVEHFTIVFYEENITQRNEQKTAKKNRI